MIGQVTRIPKSNKRKQECQYNGGGDDILCENGVFLQAGVKSHATNGETKRRQRSESKPAYDPIRVREQDRGFAACGVVANFCERGFPADIVWSGIGAANDHVNDQLELEY